MYPATFNIIIFRRKNKIKLFVSIIIYIFKVCIYELGEIEPNLSWKRINVLIENFVKMVVGV